MGSVLGLLLGLGVLLLLDPGPARPTPRAATARPLRRRLDSAGLGDVPASRVVATCLGTGVAGGVVMLVVSASPAVALVFAVLGCWLPLGALSRRASRRHRSFTTAWPDAVDDLASSVRAGMSLPDAVSALAVRGPEPLRPAFARFSADHRVTGSFGTCLDRLKLDLSDPVGDRVVEALRLARDVGGTELGRLLRTLSSVLRDEARTRTELEARQGWAVNAARLAVAAPWATLAFLSLRPGALAAYDSAGGVVVLAGAAGSSAAAYAVMRRIGRLPGDERVLS